VLPSANNFLHFISPNSALLAMTHSYLKINFHESASDYVAAERELVRFRMEKKKREADKKKRRKEAEKMRKKKAAEKIRSQKEAERMKRTVERNEASENPEMEKKKSADRQKRKKKTENPGKEMATTEARKKTKENLSQAYVDQDKELTGKVTQWNNTYGFIRILKPPEAKPLGSIFVHQSDLPVKEEANQQRRQKWLKAHTKVAFKIVREDKDRVKAIPTKVFY